jgi:hypothetical protein
VKQLVKEQLFKITINITTSIISEIEDGSSTTSATLKQVKEQKKARSNNQEHKNDISARQDQPVASQEELKRHESQPTETGGLSRQTGSLPRRIKRRQKCHNTSQRELEETITDMLHRPLKGMKAAVQQQAQSLREVSG